MPVDGTPQWDSNPIEQNLIRRTAGCLLTPFPMPNISASQVHARYDAVVVGSGGAGGQAAYTLAMDGAKVLMLESGRDYHPGAETPMFQSNFHAPLRGAGTPDKPLFFYDATVDGGWELKGEPYTHATDNDRERFWWWRSRMLGGRTNHWGRNAVRYGPDDFNLRSRTGLGLDWPIGYDDLAPYYDKVEMLIGVFGTNENFHNTSHSSPGVLMPPPKPRIGELYLKKKIKHLGIDVYPVHRAVMTVRLDDARLPAKLHPNNPKAQRILREDMKGRAACFWATPCPRGCSIRATYQSTTVHLPPALATGNLDIVCQAVVTQVEIDRAGVATGVTFIDRHTGTQHRARGRTVILAAGAYESVRLMMNSRPAHFPDGVGNNHGLLGKYITDNVSTTMQAQIPALENLPPHNEDGAGGHHIFIPWWLHHEQKSGALDFAGCYEVLFSNGRKMPSLGTGTDMDALTRGGFGRQFKRDVRRYYGSFVGFKSEGVMFPNDRTYCELDPVVKDRWGLPVLKFHWHWTEQEFRQAAHSQSAFVAMVDAMGGRLLKTPDPTGRTAIAPGGYIKHDVGGAIMGVAPGTSVTNAWGQVWGVPNLFVVDGAVFSANSEKPPTLTLLALAWRTADHILERLRQGEFA